MNKILIFAKSPIKGKVKTRLKKDTPLTDDDILKLYTAFLKDTIISASLSKAQRIYVAYYPEDSRDVMLRICHQLRVAAGFSLRNAHTLKGVATVELFPQTGDDFDTRLTNALKNISPPSSPPPARGGGKRWGDNIIILGSDSPLIQPSTINKAFKFLSTPNSKLRTPNFSEAMVLGPSGEGGVYLIGLKYEGNINFKGVFTSENESDNLLKIARRKKMPLLILEELTDVDVKSDLITLISNLSMMKYSSKYARIYLPKHTIRVIKRLGLGIDRKGDGTREKYLTIGKIYAD